MARAPITPTIQSPDQVALNLTSLVASANGTTAVAPPGTGAGNGVSFPNLPGLTKLVIGVGTTVTTLTVNIGTTEFGQGAAGFSVGPLTASAISEVGMFHTAMSPTGSNIVTVDFSSVTNIICAVVQYQGVY